MKTFITVGATTVVSLPEFCIKGLQARVDTGAATCALHASSIEFDEQESVLKVILFDPDSDFYTGQEHVFTDFVVRNVRNSFGKRMSRPMVKTKVTLAKETFEVLVGFSDRTKLTYDMLIGRNLLEQGFVVDVSK
jgi:hypothetical protein